MVLTLDTFILVLMKSRTENHEKNLISSKILIRSIIAEIIDVSVNKYGVKCRTSLRFVENKGWIDEIDPCGWFQWYFRYWLGRRSEDDERQINRWKRIVSRFRVKLVRLIKDAGSKFVIIQFCDWGYELTEKDFLLT